MAISDTKQITEYAYRIVSTLSALPVQRQQEIIIVAQTLVNMEAGRAQQQGALGQLLGSAPTIDNEETVQ